MLLLIIIISFYIMHVHFLLKNIFWGVSGEKFFIWFVPYRFSCDVAWGALVFGGSCAAAFVIGYVISSCALYNHSVKPGGKVISDKDIRKAVWCSNIFLAAQIGFAIFLISKVGLNYSALFDLKMSMSFLSEIRMVPLLLVSFVYLNKPPSEWLKGKGLKFSAIMLTLYFIVSVLMQSRSVVFEFAMIFAFSWLMWQGNKIKIRYIIIVLCAMIIPNLMVMPRFGGELDWQTIIAGIFSFEYTVVLSNIVSSAIAQNQPPLLVDFFIGIPSRVIPSFLRNVLGIGITPGTGGDYYWTVLCDAGVYGGGYSLLGEMYINLGWWGILMFTLFGFSAGKFIKGASRVGSVSLLYATAPLIYAHFLLAFRNDFGTFAKASIQIILLAIIMNFVLRIRWFPRTSAANEWQGFKRIDTTIKAAMLQSH